MKKETKKIGSGRLPKEGETKRSYTVSLLPSRRDQLVNKYGSLTLALDKVKIS